MVSGVISMFRAAVEVGVVVGCVECVVSTIHV